MQGSNRCREWGIFAKHRAIDRLSGQQYSRGQSNEAFKFPIRFLVARLRIRALTSLFHLHVMINIAQMINSSPTGCQTEIISRQRSFLSGPPKFESRYPRERAVSCFTSKLLFGYFIDQV